MTFLHIHDQGLAKAAGHALGERRSDHATADNIRDALRAQGMHAAAQAMACQRVNLSTALRVLTAVPGKRREGVTPVIDAVRQSAVPRQSVYADAGPVFA